MEAEVVFKSRQVLIPNTMTDNILKQLHVGHQGIEKRQCLAKECVYWSQVNDDMRECVDLAVCVEYGIKVQTQKNLFLHTMYHQSLDSFFLLICL